MPVTSEIGKLLLMEKICIKSGTFGARCSASGELLLWRTFSLSIPMKLLPLDDLLVGECGYKELCEEWQAAGGRRMQS